VTKPKPLQINLRSTKRVDRRYRLEQWCPERRAWIALAHYQEIDFAVLDRRASIATDAEMRVVKELGIVVAEWADGVRAPELKGWMAS